MNAPSTNNVDSQAYAIDAELMNKGRHFALTKRRVRFSFGFGNKTALERGESGQACRGEEHQVVLIWSLTSGKQRILTDGIEVHFHRGNSFADRLDCQWTMKNGHNIRVLGKRGLKGDISQFDLQIDGLSYWKMPQIYQLGGLKTVKPARRRTLTPPSSFDVSTCSSYGSELEESCQQQLPESPVVVNPKSYQRAESAPLPSPTNVMYVFDMSEPLPKNPLNQALESLVDMNSSMGSMSRSPSTTDFSVQSVTPQTSQMWRSPSTSDLSVQSAYAPTSYCPAQITKYPTRQDWNVPPTATPTSQYIYTFAG